VRLEHLTADELARVRALRAAEGQARAAALLNVSEVTLESILCGNPILPTTAQRVRAALARLA
jgi:hypothetical protein